MDIKTKCKTRCVTNTGSMSNFCGNERGSVAVEAALLFPVCLLFVWFFSASAYTWRLEGAVHRATAALADVLANQRAAEGEQLDERISRGTQVAGEMFVQMVTGEEDSTGTLRSRMQYGVQIEYLNTVPGSDNTYSTSSYSVGSLQCQDNMDSLEELATPGRTSSLVTDDNMGQLELIKVVGCVSYPGMSLETWVFPSSFTSTFVATRRESE